MGRQTPPLRVDAKTVELITGLESEAVLESRRKEMCQTMLEKLRGLDGSVTSSVSMLTGVPAEDIERLGGVGEESRSVEPAHRG